MKLLGIFALVIAVNGCSTGSRTNLDELATQPETKNVISKSVVMLDTSTVKLWLTNVIIDYASNDDLTSGFNNMRSALTDDYYNYKQDAINMEYDSEITWEQFHQKWKWKYDTKYVGKGGFFISTQDQGKITVPVCNLVSSIGDTALVYNVVIRDLDFKTDFIRDITIVTRGQRVLIDDIKEYH